MTPECSKRPPAGSTSPSQGWVYAKKDDVLWRYMDIFKLLDLLRTSQLHFTRADQMEDPWEGVQGVDLTDQAGGTVGAHQPVPEGLLKERRRLGLESVFLNCWHQGNDESYAMWRLYGPSGDGVAIRTTVGRLQAALKDDADPTYSALVSYVDLEQVRLPVEPVYYPFAFKRKCYAFESEYRVVKYRHPPQDFNEDRTAFKFRYGDPSHPEYLRADVSLVKLIEGIYVSPDSRSWVAETIRAAVGKFAPGLSVVQSNLGQLPRIDRVAQ